MTLPNKRPPITVQSNLRELKEFENINEYGRRLEIWDWRISIPELDYRGKVC